jgi:hypothetical protein
MTEAQRAALERAVQTLRWIANMDPLVYEGTDAIEAAKEVLSKIDGLAYEDAQLAVIIEKRS